MRVFKQAVVGLAMLGALAAPAIAAEGGEGHWQLTDGMVITTLPNGAVVQKKVTDATTAATLMKEATPLAAGVMIMMHDGKVYMITDKKMPNGKMLSEWGMGQTMGGGG
jgi:hypothetical protein